MENNAYTDSHPALTLGDIKDIIERSWRTGEMPVEKPDLTSEHEKIYLKNKLPEVLHLHDRKMLQTMEETGLYQNMILTSRLLPELKIGMWGRGGRISNISMARHVLIS
tara:strand:+ start:157 stop:483 length:327 start_codon:yes stop_codon:yes gene_type:complete